MVSRSEGFGLLASALVVVSALVAPPLVLAQEAGPQPSPASSAARPDATDGGNGNADAAQPQSNRGFWATFAHSTPFGLSTRSPGEGGFWSGTREGMGRIWSDGRPSLIVSGYAWHLPWKHKTERQKAFNDAAWGGGFAIDATDDPDSKYLLNRTAIETGRPFVYGGVARTSGLALAVQPRRSACLACVFPPQLSHGNDSCAALGILAPVAGVIGALQAQLALRLLETATASAGLLYVYEMRGRRWRTLRFERDPQCSTCSAAAQHAA